MSLLISLAVSAIMGALFYRTGVQGIVVLGLCFVCLVPLLVSFYRGTLDVFEPIVFYSLFMTMTTVAIVDRLYVKEPYLRHPEVIPWDFSTAFFLLSTVYLLFFSLVLTGYYLPVERWVDVPSFAPEPDRHSATIFRSCGAFYTAVGFAFYVFLVGSALDWDLLRLYTTTEPRSQLFAGSYHLLLGARLLYIGYFLWLLSALLRGDRPGLLNTIPVLPIFVLFLLLGGRQRAITILLVLVIIYFYVHVRPVVSTTSRSIRFKSDALHRKLKYTSLPLLGAFVGVIVVFARILRSWRDFEGVPTSDVLIDLLTFGIHNEHLDYLLVTLEVVPEEIGYYWGTFVLRVPLNYIPRSLWDGKPVLTIGAELRRVVLPNQAGGRDPGLLGQFFADAGFAGIVVGALVFGIILRLSYVFFERNSRSPVVLIVYAFVVASIVPGGIDNNALIEVFTNLSLLAPIVTLDWILSIRR